MIQAIIPSDQWLQQLDKLNTQLKAYEQEHQISLQQEQFTQFYQQLEAFRNTTIYEPYLWHQYYLPALDK